MPQYLVAIHRLSRLVGDLEARFCGGNPATRIRAPQHEGRVLGRHHQHLQAERPFADRHHGRVSVSRRQR